MYFAEKIQHFWTFGSQAIKENISKISKKDRRGVNITVEWLDKID